MALFWVMLAVVAVVALYIISSKGQSRAPARGRNNSGAQAYQIANNIRILLESAQIINKTTKYDTKLSRSKLMREVFKRLNDYNGSHLTKDEQWFNIVQAYEKYFNDMEVIDHRRFQALCDLKTNRSGSKCPYCVENTFQEGSRAVKCNVCGKKSSRLKIAKDESLLVLTEELEKILAIEKEALDLSPNIPTNNITVSPQVAMAIKHMEEKLTRMSGKQ